MILGRSLKISGRSVKKCVSFIFPIGRFNNVGYAQIIDIEEDWSGSVDTKNKQGGGCAIPRLPLLPHPHHRGFVVMFFCKKKYNRSTTRALYFYGSIYLLPQGAVLDVSP